MIVEKISSQSHAPLKVEHSISNQNWVEAPQVVAAFSVRHDGSSISLYYQVEEPHVMAVNTSINSPVWEDSCVEFFVSFPGVEQNGGDIGYYNLEFNAIGTVLGAFGKNRNDRKWLPDAVLEQVETVPSLGREPVDILSTSTSWNLGVKIPLQTFCFHDMKDLTGVDVHANFYKCGDRLKKPHFLSWKPVNHPTPDFHQPRYFGQLSFL